MIIMKQFCTDCHIRGNKAMKALKGNLIALLALLVVVGLVYALGINNPVVTVIQYALAPIGRA